MSATSITLAGRAAAQRLMVDSCAVTRPAVITSNGETGYQTIGYATVYSGVCRIQQRGGSGSRTDRGEASVVEVSFELQIPASVTAVHIEDIVTVTASVLDPTLVGRVFRITGETAKTNATSRRFPVTEVTS